MLKAADWKGQTQIRFLRLEAARRRKLSDLAANIVGHLEEQVDECLALMQTVENPVPWALFHRICVGGL